MPQIIMISIAVVYGTIMGLCVYGMLFYSNKNYEIDQRIEANEKEFREQMKKFENGNWTWMGNKTN